MQPTSFLPLVCLITLCILFFDPVLARKAKLSKNRLLNKRYHNHGSTYGGPPPQGNVGSLPALPDLSSLIPKLPTLPTVAPPALPAFPAFQGSDDDEA
jgi:hypothetical protein